MFICFGGFPKTRSWNRLGVAVIDIFHNNLGEPHDNITKCQTGVNQIQCEPDYKNVKIIQTPITLHGPRSHAKHGKGNRV